jgi:hypothetical protein
VSVPQHIVGQYILDAELVAPCISNTDNTLHTQAAVWAKAYCVTLSIDVKSKRGLVVRLETRLRHTA